MDRNKEKQTVPEAGSVSVAGEISLQNLMGDAESIAVSGLPFQGRQIWIYNREEGELTEPVLLTMMRSARNGDRAGFQKWSGLQIIISEYKGVWSGLGIRYTNLKLRAGATDYSITVISFRNTFLVLQRAG